MGDDLTALDYALKAWAQASAIGDQRSLGFVGLTLGHIQAGLGRWSEALEIYQRILSLYRERGERHLLNEPLGGLASVHLAQGEPARALTYIEEILAYLETGGAFEGSDEPFRIYLTCYYVLRANAEPRASGILDMAYRRLQTMAARIPDAATRRLFLENVAAHREIMTAWEKHAKGESCVEFG